MRILYTSLLALSLAGTAKSQTMVLAITTNNTCSHTSNTAITCYQKHAATSPQTFMIYPPATLVDVTNSGGGSLTWSVALTGTLSTGCGGGACIAFVQQFSATAFTSGTAPSTVKVNWNGHGSEGFAVGSYTGTITFTPNVGAPQAITLTLVVEAASGETEVNAPNGGYPVGCPGTTPGNTFADGCTLQTPQMTPPAVCGTYTDPNFGGTVKRITPAGYAVEYGANTAFSANGTYLLASDTPGFIHVFRISDCMDMTGAVGGHGNIAFITMSAINDQAWYYFTGAAIHRYNFITATDTTLGTFSGAPYNFTTLYAGGTLQTSADDWVSFYDNGGGTTNLCAVNIPQLITDGAAASTNTYCRDIATDGATSLDWTGVWGVDSGNSKRYVWLSRGPPIGGRSALYSIGAAGVLDLEALGPAWPGRDDNDDQYPCTTSDGHCVSSQAFTHAMLFRDQAGHAQFYNTFQEIWGNQDYAAFSAASATQKMFRMAEEPGGGMYFSQINIYDEQPGGSDTLGAISTAPFMGSGMAFAGQFTSCTAASPPVCNIANALSGPTHVVRVDGGTGGWTCATGYWTATVTGTTITLTGATCAGAGSFSGQTVLVGDSANALQTAQNAFLGQVIAIIPGHTIKQLAMHRSCGWDDVSGTGVSYYASTTKSSMSRDGSMIAWMSNFCEVDPVGAAVYIVNTGLTPATPTGGSRIGGGARLGGNARTN